MNTRGVYAVLPCLELAVLPHHQPCPAAAKLGSACTGAPAAAASSNAAGSGRPYALPGCQQGSPLAAEGASAITCSLKLLLEGLRMNSSKRTARLGQKSGRVQNARGHHISRLLYGSGFHGSLHEAFLLLRKGNMGLAGRTSKLPKSRSMAASSLPLGFPVVEGWAG